jgi:hypothetical protein
MDNSHATRPNRMRTGGSRSMWLNPRPTQRVIQRLTTNPASRIKRAASNRGPKRIAKSMTVFLT